MSVTRDGSSYAGQAVRAMAVAGAVDVSTPAAGFYRMRLSQGTIAVAIRLWFGPPHDPVTGEEMDRSWRWQAQTHDGELLPLEMVWPQCAKSPISEANFVERQNQHQWAQRSAPESAYADRRQKFNILDPRQPLPF